MSPIRQLPCLLRDGVRPLAYLRSTPPNVSTPWPLVLFLHGAGERGTDLRRVRTQGLPRALDDGLAFPGVVLSPQCPRNTTWSSPMIMASLRALLDRTVDELPIDRERIYVTGLSMGGYGTWALASECPERFTAAIPICGGGNPRWAERLDTVRIWAFHGDADAVVPLRESQIMVRALERRGAPVKFTVYSGIGHDSWTPTYADPAVYTWLLAQRRTTRI